MKRPNLLFLITDQQRGDTVAPGSPCRTPNLDALAAGGARFSRCYTVNPICSPTRASLMTGTLPHTHGMVDCTHAVPAYRAEFDAGLAVWPRRLQESGYRTAYFGKWHVERSDRLERFGFDEYDVRGYQQRLGLVRQEERLPIQRVVQHPGYSDFTLFGVSDQPPETTAEFRLYSEGIEFLRRTPQPWLLFLSAEAPHDPYIVPRACYERYDPAALPQPASFHDDLAGRPAIYRRLQGVWRDLDWPDFAQATACYYAACSLVDDQVGRLVAALEDSGQLENTVIVFTSDHGDLQGAHRLLLKGVPAFEEGYRVPLILRGPGVRAGLESERVVSLLDLPRTLMQLTLGEDFPCQGRTLLPLLQGVEDGWRDEAFAEMHGQRFAYTQRTLWQDRWKYVFNGFDEDELYDLAADPHELRNRAGDPACREVLARLAGRMWQIAVETGDEALVEAQYGMFRFAPVGPEADWATG